MAPSVHVAMSVPPAAVPTLTAEQRAELAGRLLERATDEKRPLLARKADAELLRYLAGTESR